MVELIEVLHVAEYDVLFVDDPWWNLLHTARHLPKICLQQCNPKCFFLLCLCIYYNLFLALFSHNMFLFSQESQVKRDQNCLPGFYKDAVLLALLTTG